MTTQNFPDFNISSDKFITQYFLSKGIKNFYEATKFISALPYGRNMEKNNPACIFEDGKGTCSTKHAALRLLALEHNRADVELILGIYKMNAQNTSKAASVLNKYGLEYLPEAHNYLRIENQRLDFTTEKSRASSFEKDLLQEQNLEYNNIAKEKVIIHQAFLRNWLLSQTNISYNFDDIWKIREACIAALSE